MDYILMNKEVPCALFSCEQDEFGEESAILHEWYTAANRPAIADGMA